MQLMQWLNPPVDWSDRQGQIWIKTGLKTDFWRTTHYGFIRDSGHFFFREISGEHYTLLRLADFPHHETVAVGLMCASPKREGFEVTFDNFELQSTEKT